MACIVPCILAGAVASVLCTKGVGMCLALLIAHVSSIPLLATHSGYTDTFVTGVKAGAHMTCVPAIRDCVIEEYIFTIDYSHKSEHRVGQTRVSDEDTGTAHVSAGQPVLVSLRHLNVPHKT